MEATAALDFVIELAAMGVGVEFIISDDDSTMRAHLKHIGTHAGAKLPLDIPKPTFLCDPSHRVKVMVKDIFKLALASKKVSECEKIDTLRFKKYIGCFIAKNKLLPFEEFKAKAKAKAPIEHLSACHEWCDCEWCYSKGLDMVLEQLKNGPKAVTVPPTLPPFHPRQLSLVKVRSLIPSSPRSLIPPCPSLSLSPSLI